MLIVYAILCRNVLVLLLWRVGGNGCYKVVLRNNWKTDALIFLELLRCSSNLIFCFNPNYFTVNSFILRSWHRSLCLCCSDYSAHGCLLDWENVYACTTVYMYHIVRELDSAIMGNPRLLCVIVSTYTTFL